MPRPNVYLTLEDARSFATRSLGLQVGEQAKQVLYLRSDDRAHTLCYFEGDPQDQAVAFEVEDADKLNVAGATLDALGHAVHAGRPDECALRKVKAFIAFKDPTGNSVGVDEIEDEETHRPRQFGFEPSSLCMWGRKISTSAQARPAAGGALRSAGWRQRSPPLHPPHRPQPFTFQTAQAFAISRHDRSELCASFRPPLTEGAGKAGCRSHPWAPCKR